MKFLHFAKIIASQRATIEFLRSKNLLLRCITCESCRCPMTEQSYSKSSDGYTFRCSRCKSRKSIRSRTIFENAKISFAEVLSIIYLSSLDVIQANIVETLGLNHQTVIVWQHKLRNLYSAKMLSDQTLLGGIGCVVELDESLISRQKPTRNGHARPVEERWIFGAYDRTRKIGFLQFVPNRKEETLIPLINSLCLPGTTIHTDGWSAYSNLIDHRYDHQVVIHQNHFVKPETGVHTNNVENYWKRCKAKFKRISGTYSEYISSYLDEFMWLERYGKSCFEHFDNTVSLISSSQE